MKSFKKNPDGYILSTKNKNGWYLGIVLCKKGRESESYKIHRLVAEYFIPNPDNKPEVNHKDLNKQHNYYTNLEWVSRKENYDHGTENGIDYQAGFKKYNKYQKVRSVMQVSLKGKIINTFINCKEASKATGICSRNIHQVASKTEYKPGKTRKQAGGFIWIFK